MIPCSCPLQLRNFQAALDMFSRVAALAEAEGHHPDLHLTGYNNVAIELSTHSVGEAAPPVASTSQSRLPHQWWPSHLHLQLLGRALGGHARRSQTTPCFPPLCCTVSVSPCTPLLKPIRRRMEFRGPTS